jgi:transposase-like protein
LLKATGSPAKVIQTLGYPSSPMLYHWRDSYPEYYDVPVQKHWKRAPFELKQCVIKRCFINGESVKLVAEEIGYTPSLIYKWIREYCKKGHFSSMKKNTANINVDPSDINSAEDIKTLKAQMLDMQMEIDILKETNQSRQGISFSVD